MPSVLGTPERPLRVAIIGSGPAGFYAAGSLLKSPLKVKVDVIDRLPCPYGLVRYGVAPDHQKIKNVIKVYEKTAEQSGFSYLGNVNVGKDIAVHELKRYYDAMIFASGAGTDRKLGIPGEDFLGSHTATEFVAWYNGHPEYKNREFDLSKEIAVIVGQGNVAVDVCRILSKTVDELKNTDIAKHALEVLAESKIKEVHMIGRRGPAQAAFTPVEIREFGELADCYPVLNNPDDLNLNESSQKELEDPQSAPKKKNYEILKSFLDIQPNHRKRKFVIHFFQSPIEIIGKKKVEKVILERNALVGLPGHQKSRGTGEKVQLPCGIFFRSVGYRGLPIPGVPFSEQSGVIQNQGGRVTDSEHIDMGLYCAGWIKRGPSGIIGTNKPDSEETVKHLLQDVPALKPCEIPDTAKLISYLKDKELRVVSFEDWKKIDAAEVERGEKLGKPREKFVTIQGMLSACNPTYQRG
ncbi:MAG: FAD-dependent oxidoreductase [Candidatus Omnitrophota bacterium]|nr:FAD-dependent oxidoreductase [Candidatus Omnitrophota bacterium]